MIASPPAPATAGAFWSYSRLALFSGIVSVGCGVDERNPAAVGQGGEASAQISQLDPREGRDGGSRALDGGTSTAAPDPASTTCNEGETRPCGNASGECEFGTQACVGAEWGECSGGVAPGLRDCASPLDNDCDGQADNLIDVVCACTPGEVDDRCGQFPNLHGKGACSPGTRTCLAGPDGATSLWSECVGEVGPVAEVDRCDVPNDDNCDGTENDGCPCTPGTSQECGPQNEVGICLRGVASCEDGTLGQCDAVFQRARDCASSQDNDCNGVVDVDELALCECVIGESRPCNTHPGLDNRGRCRAGTQTCEGRLDGTRSAFGACTGDVGPLPNDSCAVANDDANCDGQANGGCTCVIGVASSCANPDPQNCAVQCVRVGSDSDARCEVTALDRDRDGFGACAASNGGRPLDCNDGSADIRPGAVEVCNGSDDDCDGLIDLADGLGVGGTTRNLAARRYADVAFNAADGDFRFVSEGGESGGTVFGVLNAVNLFPLVNVDPGSATVPNVMPRIVAAANEFGIVHTVPSRGGPPGFLAKFARVNAGGTQLGLIALGATGGSEPGLGRRASGWVTAMTRLVFVDGDPVSRLELGSVNASDVYTAAANPPTGGFGAPRIALAGDASAVVWQRGATFNLESAPPAEIRLARFNANLALQGTIADLEPVGAHPDITAVGSSYFMAWAVGPGVRVRRTNVDGTVACTGASAFGDGLLDPRDAVAIENTPIGTVVLSTDFGGGTVGVFVYDAACRELQRALIAPSAASPAPRSPSTPNIAAGGGDVLFVWTEGQQASHFRLTSELICN